MPAYNVSEFIEEAIESVINQSFRDWELIIVNDGSTDNTRQVITKYEVDRRIRILDRSNGGLARARNTGIPHAIGEYVIFLDSDDALTPNALHLFDEMRLAAADSAVIVGNYYRTDESGRRIGNRKWLQHRFLDVNSPLRTLSSRPLLLMGTAAYRRSAIAGTDWFEPDMEPLEDWLFSLQAATAGPWYLDARKELLAYRIRRGSLANTKGIELSNYERPIHHGFSLPNVQSAMTAAEIQSAQTSFFAQVALIVATNLWRQGHRVTSIKTFAKAVGIRPTSIFSLAPRYIAAVVGI